MNIYEVLDEYFLAIENKDLENGNYPKVLELVKLIDDRTIWDELNARCYDTSELQKYFSSLSQEERIKVFKFGISCFVYFVQANFTGPDVKDLAFDVSQTRKFFLERLSLGHDEINPNTKFPHLLDIAKCIFENCLVEKFANLIWTLRSLIIHQQIMDETSPVILSLANDLRKQFRAHSLPDYIKAKFDLEFAQLYILLRHITKAAKLLDSVEDKLYVAYDYGGELGKRTRYQLEDLAQMTLDVFISWDSPDTTEMKRPPVLDFEVPKDIPLRDDVRLDKIKFAHPQKDVDKFPNTEQKCVLTRVQEMIISKPSTELLKEEILPFLDFILSQKNTWCVRVVTLMLRSKYENTVRTISRKISQCEEILQSYGRPSPHVLTRFADVFSTGLKPKWKTESEFADALRSIGLVKEALDMYLRVQDWESVIICYTLLNLRHKAAEVIKQQLELKETPKLWCLLGDATDSISCYEKAWELSGERSHMAKRHWANHLFERKKYKESIPHYQQSLFINPLQAQSWERLGFAALKTENWQDAATASLRYTHLEPDGCIAWNNLGHAYIGLGHYEAAQGALTVALKYNKCNWEIWDKYLTVNYYLENVENMLQAYDKILNLKKGRYLNIPVLGRICELILRHFVEPATVLNWWGYIKRAYILQANEIFARVTSCQSCPGMVWQYYVAITPQPLQAERLNRAHKEFTKPGWEKDVAACHEVLDNCIMWCYLIQKKDLDLPIETLFSIRVSLKSSLIAAMKDNPEKTTVLVEKYSGIVDEAMKKIDRITAEANQKLANIGIEPSTRLDSWGSMKNIC